MISESSFYKQRYHSIMPKILKDIQSKKNKNQKSFNKTIKSSFLEKNDKTEKESSVYRFIF